MVSSFSFQTGTILSTSFKQGCPFFYIESRKHQVQDPKVVGAKNKRKERTNTGHKIGQLKQD
jgi:hypothetical protein